MKNKKILIMINGLLILFAIPLSVSGTKIVEKFQSWGIIDKEFKDNKTLLMKGKTIKVYKEEIEKITLKYESTGVQNGREKAIKFVLKREALYAMALDNKYSVSNKEVEKKIDESKDSFAKATNKSDFDKYLQGLEMTEEEYWKEQFDVYKKEMIIEKYLNTEKESFFSGKNIDEKVWQEEVDKMANVYIENDNIKNL